MSLAHPQGAIAVLLAIICFYGMTYVVIGLNLGWRFGYWVTGATYGSLMLMLSIFWIVYPVGPRGEEPHWVPIAVGADLTTAQFNGQAISAPGQYPGGGWKPVEKGDVEGDDFSSAVTTCVSTKPDKLPDETKATCLDAQKLMPPPNDIPVLLGSPVAVQAQVTEIRLADDHGKLAEAIVRPVTVDPRISKSPSGKLLAPEFKMVAILNQGSLRVPAYSALVIFLIFFLIHLAGLNRAEKRKLNPSVV